MRRSTMFGLSAIMLASVSAVVGCAEALGTGEKVPIPQVYVDCRSSECKAINGNPLIHVRFSTSGCVNDNYYGAVIAGSTTGITCVAGNGCYGAITDWVDSNGESVTTVPSGNYSICGVIANDRIYPPATSGDIMGTLDGVSVGKSTATQFIIQWQPY